MRHSLSLLLLALLLFPVAPLAEDPIRLGSTTASTNTPPATSLHRSAPGPWGTLESYQIPLSCPDEYLPLLAMPSRHTEWIFDVSTTDEMKGFLARSGFSSDDITFLLENGTVLHDEETFRFYPKDETVADMPVELRSRLYRTLATIRGNRFHRRPVYFNTENLSRWFSRTPVSRNVIQDIANLAYPSPTRPGYFLSDIPFLLRDIYSTDEERMLIQSIYRTPALIVRLVIDEQIPIEEIAEYWSADYKNKDVLPLMRSVLMTPGVTRLEIAHLLPPMARRNLNRYPASHDGAHGRFPDWFWTCFNFFRFLPRDVYADSEERDELIASHFRESLPPHQFGDLILFQSGRKLIHGCIYIADDIVYTKNGPDLLSPWVLMNLSEVVAYHDIQGDVTLSLHRKTPPKALQSKPSLPAR